MFLSCRSFLAKKNRTLGNGSSHKRQMVWKLEMIWTLETGNDLKVGNDLKTGNDFKTWNDLKKMGTQKYEREWTCFQKFRLWHHFHSRYLCRNLIYQGHFCPKFSPVAPTIPIHENQVLLEISAIKKNWKIRNRLEVKLKKLRKKFK